MDSNEEYVSIWEIYGLQSDPFTISPILVKGGLISQKSFMGREDEIKRLEKIFRSTGGSRTIVCGMQGVGKTTLVNMARLKAIENNFFSPFQEIKVDVDWEVNDFIVNSIAAIYSSLIKMKQQTKEITELIEKLKPIFETYEQRDSNYSVSTPVGGVGFGNTTTINQAKLNSTWLTETFQTIINSIKKLGFREIILHYNNLDTFDEEEEKMKKLFNRIRDIIQIPNVHFIFVGSPTTSSIISSIPRVINTFTDTPITLEPLSLINVKKIIKTRIEHLAIEDMRYFDPTAEEAIELLYSLHNGNIRAILNSLSTAIREVTEEKPVILTKDMASNILYKIAKKRFADKITTTMQSVLMEMLKQKESTNKILAVKLKKQPQNISKYLGVLKENQCIILIRADGREKFYAIAEWIKWLLLDPQKGYQAQIIQF